MPAVRVTLELENTTEADCAAAGVRRVSVSAIVDPTEVLMVLPRDIAEWLGLRLRDAVGVSHARGRECRGPVTVRAVNRTGIFECLVAPAGTEAVLGRIPLRRLDLLVDPVQQQLVVRPESPIYPLYSVKERRARGMVAG